MGRTGFIFSSRQTYHRTRVLLNSTQWRVHDFISESLDCLIIHLRNEYGIWRYKEIVSWRPGNTGKRWILVLRPSTSETSGDLSPLRAQTRIHGDRDSVGAPPWIPGEMGSELNRRANGMGDQQREAATTWFPPGLQNPGMIHTRPQSAARSRRDSRASEGAAVHNLHTLGRPGSSVGGDKAIHLHSEKLL